MNLIEWYKENGYEKTSQGIQHLKDQFGINVKEYDCGIYVFTYNQIESPKMHPVVMECRGLILDENMNVLCRPFDRFFNFGEALEITETFEFDNAQVYEKVDGSLIKLWNHDGVWRVGTRGTAFAESENYTGEVFEKLVCDAFGVVNIWHLHTLLEQIRLPDDYTFIFEYISPKNRVVTPYTEDEMVLLAVRSNETGSYIGRVNHTVTEMRKLGLNVRAVKLYDFSSVESMKIFLSEQSSLDEGFVCHDLVNDIRIKLKSPKYVAIHRIKGETLPTPKRIMELAVTGEDGEFLTYFPEMEEQFAPYRESYEEMVSEMEIYYDQIAPIDEQKEFALEAVKRPYSGVLFAARKNGRRPLTEYDLLDPSKRVKILSSYMEEGSMR